ncbi:circularly permuted type 2 ATP-grasp protein [Rhodococcoides corynebacterioides]|uniref:Circularly permuted type 2 ATP-grasp protein n=1 Tax=Rhodococcoides corynebacterioides TaxID=53972 RepID=A0ABS7P1J7_9NOCA|nr:circularly permuted type 2 ATP-grasp protein [Rhodococcus corynebacterioides]MBY6366258.1 circularly permuted type 2 ATP-grasp protein [Rhodococcus corynebacterioides]MBY6406831.1 circularly permuted type 2 ATP-grasp protein [Rhodococcus corynebacterioides]
MDRGAGSGDEHPFAAHDTARLRAAQARVTRAVDELGVTFGVGEPPTDDGTLTDAAPAARWELDTVPLVLGSEQWARLDAGVTQRSRLLDALLTDLYGDRTVLRRGLVPPEVIVRHRGYRRAAHGLAIPGPHRLFFHAVDLIHDRSGEAHVLSDRTQAPSGAGYALADRSILARAVPGEFRAVGPRPVSTFVGAVRVALVEAAPPAAEDPTVVVLSPGAGSETAFDQAHLASVLGFPLVESPDLVVQDGAVWMRSLGRLRRVHVVVRRVDDDDVDPLDLRPDSRLGVVGLLDVARRGAVTVVNTVGSGVLENPALTVDLPGLTRALLGEEPILPGVPTFWAGDDAMRSHLHAHAASLVFHESTSGASVVGAELTAAETADLLARVDADPTAWAAREIPELGTSPVGPAGHRRPDVGLDSRPVGLRVFDVATRAGYVTMTGGLGQVLVTDPLTEPMTSTAALDVWVLRDRRAPGTATTMRRDDDARTVRRRETADPVSSPRVLNDLFWMGRYAERAESTARMLVAGNACLREHGVAERPTESMSTDPGEITDPGHRATAVVLAAITRVSGTAPGFAAARTRAEVVAEFRSLTVDARRPGSAAQSVAALARCARAVRDQLGQDTWAVLFRVDQVLAEAAAAPVTDEATLWATQSRVVGSMLAVAGLTAESMVRDPGWHLMDLGRRLERAAGITALAAAAVEADHPPAIAEIVLSAVLAAADSSVTHRRRYRGAPTLGAVIDLVLADPGNPRSIVFQIERLAVDLSALPGAEVTSRPLRALDALRATVRRLEPGDVDTDSGRADLRVVLDTVIGDLDRLTTAVVETHLSGPGGTQPLWGRGAGRVLS